MDNIASGQEQGENANRQLAAGSRQQRSMEHRFRGQRTDDRWFKVLNIEPQNKKPQNDEVITSIFCGSKRRQHR